ncbi:MAG: hypothetical protein ACRCY3_12560 [Sphingorhabdus sp.]
MLIAWPKVTGMIMMLIEPGLDGRNYFPGAWPINASVDRYEFTVEGASVMPELPSWRYCVVLGMEHCSTL